MNILPKKRWHVRNRENIARVRKDELAAQNEEKEKERRKRIAEQEAKLEALRSVSKQRGESLLNSIEEKSERTAQFGHVNFFEGVEAVAKNEEHEEEVKKEREKYEKQIGYLTYLGQNTNEADGRISWYNKPRSELNHFVESGDRKDEKSKLLLDPLNKLESILRKKSAIVECGKVDSSYGKKVKLEHKSFSKVEEIRKVNKKTQLEVLREKRLKREREEKMKIDKLLSEVRCEKPAKCPSDEDKPIKKFSRRYNSQFNPHLARQNYIE